MRRTSIRARTRRPSRSPAAPALSIPHMRRLIAIVLAGLVLAPLAAAATKGPVFGLRAVGNPKRGYFVYPLSPGGTKHGAVIVSNTGTASGTVKLFSADATTGKTSGTVYLTDQKPEHAGAWI